MGATICALGCNGPELFTNLIALYTGSDAGIGVVVGSEIFNLLIIIGCAVLFAPTTPLQIERVPFARDCMFYFLSIILLYTFIKDKTISLDESLTLLFAAACYVATVYFTEDIVQGIPCLRPAPQDELSAPLSGKKKGKMHGIEVEIQQLLHSRMADGHKEDASAFVMDVSETGIFANATDPAPIVGATKSQKRGSVGFQFADADSPMAGMLKYKDLKEVVLQESGVIELEFRSNVFSHVTLRVTCASSDDRDTLLKNIQSYSKGSYIHGYDATVIGACKHLKHEFVGTQEHPSTLVSKFGAIVHFVVDFLLKGTIWLVDVKDVRKENRWPLCFLGAMFWLAMFSYGMLLVADQIHENIPVLSTAFLGITVCAIGTSFPNMVASVIMAQQNKPAAAVANALGSNVQNVFLAMAIPWIIYSTSELDGGDIDQNTTGIDEGVIWMMFTLVLVVICVLLPQCCTISKPLGRMLIMVFFVYLSMTSYEAFAHTSFLRMLEKAAS